MKFYEAFKKLSEVKGITRQKWISSEGLFDARTINYICKMPGIKVVIMVSISENSPMTPWIPEVEDLESDDWEIFQTEMVIPHSGSER